MTRGTRKGPCRKRSWALRLALALAAGCGGDDEARPEADGNGDTDAEVAPDPGADADADATPDPGADADADATPDPGADADADADADGDGGDAGAWGFDIRLPRERVLDCAGFGGTVPYGDADWLCSFTWEDVETVVYLQATPVSCTPAGMSVVPAYDVRGFVSRGGAVVPVEHAVYDWGGNHHNDWFEFDLEELHYRGYHSSFGFGWRCCQPIDCLILTTRAGVPVQDGCTCDRTIPVACVQVAPDGTWPPLVDRFAVCPGDSTCGG